MNPMIRFALSYLVGAAIVAGAVAVLKAPDQAAAGMIAAAVILACALWTVHTAHKLSGRRRGRESRAAGRRLRPAPPARRRAAAAPVPAPAPPSAVELEVVSALVNFGARKTAATAAARYAVENHRGASFDTLFRAALNKSKAAA